VAHILGKTRKIIRTFYFNQAATLSEIRDRFTVYWTTQLIYDELSTTAETAGFDESLLFCIIWQLNTWSFNTHLAFSLTAGSIGFANLTKMPIANNKAIQTVTLK
jgi:hypothetical protein